MLPHILSVAAFMAITFAVQATNHFVVNTGHYARQPLISPEPVLWGGIAAMVIQGTVLTFLAVEHFAIVFSPPFALPTRIGGDES